MLRPILNLLFLTVLNCGIAAPTLPKPIRQETLPGLRIPPGLKLSIHIGNPTSQLLVNAETHRAEKTALKTTPFGNLANKMPPTSTRLLRQKEHSWISSALPWIVINSERFHSEIATIEEATAFVHSAEFVHWANEGRVHISMTGTEPFAREMTHVEPHGKRFDFKVFDATESMILTLRRKTKIAAIAKRLGDLPNLRRLNVSWSKGVTNADEDFFLPMANSKHLQELSISTSKIDESTVKAISKIKTLRHLTIRSGSLEKGTSSVLHWLTSLPNLTHLSLATVWLNTADVQAIAQIKSLQELNLKNTRIGDEHFHILLGLSDLRLLDISHREGIAQGHAIFGNAEPPKYHRGKLTTLKGIDRLKKLERLSVVGQNVTGEVVKIMKGSGLTHLEMDHPDDDLNWLRGFPKLEFLSLNVGERSVNSVKEKTTKMPIKVVVIESFKYSGG